MKLVCGLALLWPAVAEAKAPFVSVALEPCAGVELSVVRRQLDVEFAEGWTEQAGHASIALTLRCEPGAVVLRGRFNDQPAESVRLDEAEAAGDVGARLLVLQMVELVRALEEPRPAEPVVPAAAELQKPLWYSTAGFQFMVISPQAPLLGMSVNFGTTLLAPVYFEVGGNALSVRHAYTEGEVRARLLSGNAEGGYRIEGGRHAFGLGAGIRLGQGRIAGSSADPDRVTGTVEGLFGGPYLSGLAQVSPVGPLLLGARVEGGFATLPIRGEVEGGPDVSLAGAYLAVTFSAGGRW